ncbi:MAG: SUMF1/EgtB/PvdO family nonheme iron enzyme [Planctomycetia bacterium]|nr:SUMF1/EgtB/PvdO family nonheme iron enzyme [Planctomycetia bacterium]
MLKRWILPAFLGLICAVVPSVRAEVELTTQSWANNSDDFVTMQNDVAIGHVLNFMNFAGARIVESSGIDQGSFVAISDSLVGQLGQDGRIGVSGKPARLVVYLGKPRSIKEICIYTGNIDSRANQDYEVRFANNEQNPGQKPTFPAEPTLTTGDKILGSNGGGFKTSFRETEDGKFIGDGKYDWVEFRFWQTYPSKAGDPAKSKSPANSWTSLIEVQIVGDEKDPNLYGSEEEKVATQEMMARRALEMKLRKISADAVDALGKMDSLQMAIEDLAKTFPDKYDGEKYLAQLKGYRDTLLNIDPQDPKAVENALKTAEEFLKFRREALLANPLLDFDKVLVRTATNAGLEANWMSNCSRGKKDYGNRIQWLSLSDPNAELHPLIEPPKNSFLGDICLHWDAKRILVTALSDKNTWEVFEVHLDKPTEFKQISPFLGPDVDNVEGCYLPDGAHLFISSASMMGVPCIGGAGHVGNIFRVEKDGKTTRQLTFEQDQDWCPVVLNNGRVMFLRWEYVDTNHYFTRIMMHMNPDGSNQIEYYGSNSYWPNSMFYGKPIPNSSKFVTIVTGHHGAAQRQGELVIFDPKLGRHEADGVVQRIPHRGQKVEPIIRDALVDNSWPKFLFPFPLSENYYLVSCRLTPQSPWGLYLVDTFDNMLLIKESTSFGIFEPQALVERPVPPVVASRLIEGETDSTVFVTDVHFGPGLKDVPRGTIKKLRLFGYQYGYRGIGNHDMMGIEASWDSKILLGEVPVYEDGSAFFRIPANTPIAIQPLDEKGNAVQIMRSWLVGMPGEGVTCAGCHESQNSATPSKRTIAMTRPPVPIQEFNGESRPMGFRREVQPVLDKYCVGCHDGSEPNRPNLKDVSRPREAWNGHFGRSYIDLMPYVRRPGPESDVHMFNPMEYHTNTSPLFQMLRDGNHYNVKLDDLSWRSLALWVDMNVPYHATWTEVSEAFRGNADGVQRMAKRTQEIRSLYANLHQDPEHGSNHIPDRPEWVKPEEWKEPNTAAPAGAKVEVAGELGEKMSVDLGGVEMELVRVPAGKFVIGDDCKHPAEANRNEVAIEKSFFMGTTEVTNEMYALFDPHHDSRYIDQQWKDHTWPGYAHNFPQQPVVRVTWQEAVEFCKWLSEKTGKKFRLPTEAEWEWAAKAGKDQPFWWGGLDDDFGPYANLADRSLRLFVCKGVNPRPVKAAEFEAFWPRIDTVDDGQLIPGWDTATHANSPASDDPGKGVACYQPNPWGLFDMNGNVAEWTYSDYKPYPYNANDGRNAGDPAVEKVARGGSWFDRPKTARSGYRLPYFTWQRVYNVGFRVICEE